MAAKKKVTAKKISYVRVTLDFVLGIEGRERIIYGLGPDDTMRKFILGGIEAINMTPAPVMLGGQHVSIKLHPKRYGSKLPGQ